MDHAVAFLIFTALAAACWFAAVAVYRATTDGPDPAAAPGYPTVALAAAAAVGLTGFLPAPWGLVAGLVVWWVAAHTVLTLPGRWAAVLLIYLAAGSVATRLIVLAALEVF